MSSIRLDFLLVTVCGAASLAACAASDGLVVPVDGTDGFTTNGAAQATSGEQTGSRGQTAAGTQLFTGGRPSTGGQSASGGRSVSASGGTLRVWSATSVGGRTTAGGVNGLVAASGKGGVAGLGVTTGKGGVNGSGGTPSSGGADGFGSSLGLGGGDTSAAAPVLPSITGTCPTFQTGTVTVAGLGGISLQVGARKEGTGSLLFYWHGTGSTAAEVNLRLPASVKQEILNQGGIIASFGGSLGTGGDCSGTAIFSMDDFKVADLIAACAVKDHTIDPRRIYTTGCSAGGLQSGCMAAMRSGYLAASVPNSGGEVFQQTIQDAKHIPSVMTMHGGASDWVIVSFTDTSATMDKHMENAGGFVVNCNHGGGHCGAPAALYTAAWEFMKAHPFGVKPLPYAAGLPATFPTYCTIY